MLSSLMATVTVKQWQPGTIWNSIDVPCHILVAIFGEPKSISTSGLKFMDSASGSRTQRDPQVAASSAPRR
jgi:hypothetical protein